MELFWIMTGLFVFITVLFIVIAFLFPELVGITGKKAQEIMNHQRGDLKGDSTQNEKNP